MKIVICLSSILLLAASLSAQYYGETSQSTDQEYSSTRNRSGVTVKVVNHPKFGKILTDSKGMTLYMFTPDENNTSTCYDQCAVAWPPLLISSGRPSLSPGIDGMLDVITRRDNTSQVTYNGMPLYYYFKDKKPGDAYGQNVESKWYVINPDSEKY